MHEPAASTPPTVGRTKVQTTGDAFGEAEPCIPMAHERWLFTAAKPVGGAECPTHIGVFMKIGGTDCV